MMANKKAAFCGFMLMWLLARKLFGKHLKDESANMLKTVEDLEVSRRSREFLWQEGHTAFATKEEADTEFAAEGLSARPCFSCS
ncbi:hypothetical protein ES288_D12G105900v1 [Gossypium darwinii]|uniref:Uncharacterized protein n=1 Tax=Gossypium darwinii TaxID=34276 RepID=A0A5D2A6X2_GOSDA|nr:hypothetical protein ES288_D12G105900v1 [Gossypium darwinii]